MFTALVLAPTLSGCASRDAWPLWINSYSVRGAIAIVLIPIVLYAIYKGYYDDRPGL